MKRTILFNSATHGSFLPSGTTQTFVLLVLLLLVGFQTPATQDGSATFCDAYSMIAPAFRTRSFSASSSVALFGKSRKARRMQKVERSRPKSFYDAIEDANDTQQNQQSSTATKDPEDDQRGSNNSRMEEAQRRMDERPEISTMIYDEETGMELVAQGKNVMDVITRKPVVLSPLGPEYRLAQLFPGVPPDIREKFRFDWRTVEVPEMVEQLREACSVQLEDGSVDIPPHPSVANKAIDFVLANRDLMGARMKSTLGRLTMRAFSLGQDQEGAAYQKLWKNFLTLENHISAPFRQMMMDAEGRVGPNFGNLEVKSFCDGELYERTANYLVLKGMVAQWEKKVVDADYVERTPQGKDNYVSILARGDPRRYLPDPPILFTLKECTQVAYMAQQMTKAFVETPELFDDLPPEIRFIESAFQMQGGTALRKFMIEEFCPKEGITPEALREGMRRLIAQLDNMQTDPYGDITNKLEQLEKAMSVGSDDERSPYAPYILSKGKNGPGHFQTYTFNHEKLSLVRFLDSQYDGGTVPEVPSDATGGVFGGLFNFGGESKTTKPKETDKSGDTYRVPAQRAAGRPHNLGWLDKLKEESEDLRLGKVKAGRIIPDQ